MTESRSLTPRDNRYLVLGFPRSGTTLLRRILDAHPDINCPPETNLFSACGRFLHEDPAIDGLTIGVLPGLAFSGIEEDEVLSGLRDLAFRIHEKMAAAAGKRVWVEKTAFDIFYLEQLERLLVGHCKFLCITRNPLDVIVSVKDLADGMDQIMAELHPYVRTTQSLYDAFANAWIDRNTALRQFIARNSADCLDFRYEDLLVDPQATVNRISSFMKVSSPPESLMETVFGTRGRVGLGDWRVYDTNAIDKSRMERWREQLPASTVARVLPRLRPLMEELGYPLPKVRSTPGRDEAIRRYVLAKSVRQMAKKAE